MKKTTLILAVLLLTTNLTFAQEWSRDVTISWNANTETDLLDYKLYENGSHVETILAGTETVTRTITTPGAYVWYLTARDQSLNESQPSTSVGLTLDQQPPVGPVNINVTVTVTIQ